MKKSKFLDKMVAMVDKAFYKVAGTHKGSTMGDEITIYWDYDQMTMRFVHDTYGDFGQYSVENLYRVYQETMDAGKVKNFHPCKEFVEAVVSDMLFFIRENRNPIIDRLPDWMRSCHRCSEWDLDEDEPFEDNYDEEEDFEEDFDVDEYEEDFEEEDEEEVFDDFDEEEVYDDCEGCELKKFCNYCNEQDKQLKENEPAGFEEPNEFPSVAPVTNDVVEEIVGTKATVSCPVCGGSNIRKYGKSRSGKQKWECKDCKRQFTEQ